MPHPRLTPAMRTVLERRARVSAPPLHTLPPVQARAAYEAASGVLEVPRANLCRVEDFTVPARDGHPLPAVSAYRRAGSGWPSRAGTVKSSTLRSVARGTSSTPDAAS